MGETVLTGRYDIRGLAERDDTGERWRAADLALRRPVVIWLSQPDTRTGVPNGAGGRVPLVARVVHPNVLRTYDAGFAADGRGFLVREFVEGTDLAALSRTCGALPAEQVADIAVQLARGLEAIHATGAVLGRVEPTGQLLTKGGGVKITALDAAQTVESGTGLHAGSPAYVAPERAFGQPASAASDWYGLGCVLHLLLVGRPPFTGDAESVLIAQVSESPTPVQRLRPDVDPRLAGLVDALLAKDPGQRPASAAEFEARLAAPEQTAILADLSGGAQPAPLDPDTDAHVIRLAVPPALRRRRTPLITRARRLTGAGSVVTAVLVVVAGAVLFGATNEQAQSGSAALDIPPSHKVPSARLASPPPPQASTRRPSRDQTTPRPTVTPTTRPVSHSSPAADPAAPLRNLAALLRADRRAENNQDLQSAATLLDRAADRTPATDLVGAAFGQLADAERAGSWHPSGPESTLLAALGYRSPTTRNHHRHDG